jgi:hypothetical protein
LIAGELAILQQVFDFGDAGAQVLQVESSFETLLRTVGGAPDMLNQLRDATQGTVSDLDLMSSATTFLAGTTGELSQSFADALPELAAVARAASLLNPAVGDASVAFDRLALGIKKAEPELLDELGILLNLNQVYKEYGASIGKSADDLTKAEKSQAMLNAVLSQGRVLIEQAGGAAVQAATSIDRMQAAVDNAGNAFQAKLAPAIANAADAVYYMLTGMDQLNGALAEHAGEVAATSSSYSEYITEMNRAAGVLGYQVNANGDLVQSLATVGDGAERVIQSNFALTHSQFDAANAATEMSYKLDELAQYTQYLGEVNGETTATVGMSADAWAVYGERLTAAAEAAGHTAITMDELQIMSVALAAGLEGELGGALTNYSETMAQLQAENAALTTEMQTLQAAGVAPTTERFQELSAALDANLGAQGEALAGLQQLTAEMIYNQAATGLNTQSSLELARSMGVLSETDYTVAASVEALRQEFDKNGDSMIDASESAGDYVAQVNLMTRAIQSLEAKNAPITFESIAQEMEAVASADAAGALAGTASEADQGVQPLEDIAAAAADAAEGTGSAAGTGEDLAGALEAVKSAASSASGPLNSLAGPLRTIYGPLSNAAGAAVELGDGLRAIPRNAISISISTSGFPAAISYINQVADGLNDIPNSVNANIRISSSGGGGAGGQGGPQGGGGGTPDRQDPYPAGKGDTYIINNPLAAAMLIEQKRSAKAQEMEALING